MRKEKVEEEDGSRRLKLWCLIMPGNTISYLRSYEAVIPDRFEAVFNDKD